MENSFTFRLQIIVFGLVSVAFTNLYVTQPVLPVLQQEFSVDLVLVSLTVSSVILGITLSNLPFGFLSDRLSVHPIILTGGTIVSIGGLVCAFTGEMWILISARFIQGLFIPSLTTCLAAYLAKTLPIERLNVVMGSYVSATVLGGLSGRLFGGWIHPPLHWRYAFITVSILTFLTTIIAVKWLPKYRINSGGVRDNIGFFQIVTQWKLLRIFLCATGSFAIFSSVFNYLPYRLSESQFGFSTEVTTLFYLVYVVGIFIGPITGRVSNRFGSGNTLVGGSIILACALVILYLPFVVSVVIGLILICAGFFTVHSAAVGALNRKLSSGQGRANALYVLFYYIGGWLGITGAGLAYKWGGWSTLMQLTFVLVIIPFSAGLGERRSIDVGGDVRERVQ